ncbi:DUF1800 domain-containing protein [Nocardioides ferulae]|uniref:DUF1800 domain-containing protein n=1 Tax=Nocardioides ferulae TaxID=2340821 RepID=UPI000EB30F3B|nr:DUF1800 domain-containing protein [Nocardioides ferulae]
MPKPVPTRTSRPLPAADGHLVRRFSYGLTPGLAAQVRRRGGARGWFEWQLQPEQIGDPRGDALFGWWSGLARGPQELWRRQVEEVEGGWEVMSDYQRWVLMRRIVSQRQLHEVVAELWENHLNVPVHADGVFTHRVDYGLTVRRHALGRFEDLLRAAVIHPAMLIFLDGAVSTARHPNENLGRELLELHTVGRGEFDEDDVKAAARILTGYTVDLWHTWAASYQPRRHWRGPVQVMGFTDPNAEADGRAVVHRFLGYLARHPATARRVARRLAVKFVRDDPSAELVDHLAEVYLASETEIRPVLRALVDSSEFRASAGLKVRDPGEDLVASYRVLRARVQAPPEGPAGDRYAATQMLWSVGDLGVAPFEWPRPDGQPIDNESWSSPSRLIGSLDLHLSLSGRWWPTAGITYRTPEQWLPRRALRFSALVEHLSRQLLGRPSTDTLLRACCQAVGVSPDTRITADHAVMRWQFPNLLTTFLDSPAHLTR